MATNSGRSDMERVNFSKGRSCEVKFVRPLPQLLPCPVAAEVASLETTDLSNKDLSPHPAPAIAQKTLTLTQINRIYRSAHPFKKKNKQKKRRK